MPKCRHINPDGTRCQFQTKGFKSGKEIKGIFERHYAIAHPEVHFVEQDTISGNQ